MKSEKTRLWNQNQFFEEITKLPTFFLIHHFIFQLFFRITFKSRRRNCVIYFATARRSSRVNDAIRRSSIIKTSLVEESQIALQKCIITKLLLYFFSTNYLQIIFLQKILEFVKTYFSLLHRKHES